MKFTVKFMVREACHINGTYEDFLQARDKCLELVDGAVADCSWVELTEQPELRSNVFLKKVVPEPVTEPVQAVLRKKKK